jgi:hypothetical protein
MAAKIYEIMKEGLEIAHGGVLHYFAEICRIQGWSTVRGDFQLNKREEIGAPEEFQRFLNQNKSHTAAATGSGLIPLYMELSQYDEGQSRRLTKDSF